MRSRHPAHRVSPGPCVFFPLLALGLLAFFGRVALAAQPSSHIPLPAKTLTVAVAYAPKTLDPALASDAAAARLLQLTNPALLFTTGGVITPLVATGCNQPTPQRVLCTLPPGRKFQDGTPLTATTLAGWFRYLALIPRSPYNGPLKGVTIATPTSATLAFSLPSPTLSFPSLLAQIPLAPSPTLVSTTAVGPEQRPGMGAWSVASKDTLGNVTLALASSTTPLAGAYTQLVMLVVPDATTRLLKLKQHEVDVVDDDLPPELYQWGLKQGFAGVSVPSASYAYIGYNFKNEYLANPAVRLAIARIVNRPVIRKYLLGGLATPADTLLPPNDPLAWHAPEETPVTSQADLLEEEDLLDGAGFTRGPAVGDVNDARFTLTLLTSTDALSQRLAQVLQQQLKPIGIAVKLEPTEWGAFYDRVRQGRFDAVLLSWAGEQPPEFLYQAFESHQAPPNGLNRGHVNDTQLDTLLNQVHTATTPAQLKAATIAAQQRLAELRPTLPLYRRNHVLLMAPGIRGCQLDLAGSYLGLLACRKH